MNYSHLEQYYKGKKVFLTGHTGFKGSWMLYWLHLLGAEVQGYALEPENSFDLYNSLHGDEICKSTISDIRDKQKLRDVLESFQPDFIFHLAAQPLVRLSYQIPTDTFEINAMGTANILDCVRSLKKSCAVVLVTTDKVYENKEWHYPYRETDRLGGYDPYSASKACAELIISSFRNSFFNVDIYKDHQKAVASARAGNVIGGGDWAKDRIIPDIIRSLSNNQILNVRNPSSVRPWQHVLEPIGGYLHLGSKLVDNPERFSKSWNFGPYLEDNLTVEELVKIALDKWGNGNYKISTLSKQPHEAGLLKLDISNTINELDWKPKLNATTSIEWTLDFYKNRDQGISEIKLVIDQITKIMHD